MKEEQLEFLENLFISYAEGSMPLKKCIEKIEPLVLGLEIIANGDPISVGLDEITDVAKKALDKINEG